MKTQVNNNNKITEIKKKKKKRNSTNTPQLNKQGGKNHTKTPPKENMLCSSPQTYLNPQSQG